MGECQNREGSLRGDLELASDGVGHLRHVDYLGGWIKTCGASLASLFYHCQTYQMGGGEELLYPFIIVRDSLALLPSCIGLKQF